MRLVCSLVLGSGCLWTAPHYEPEPPAIPPVRLELADLEDWGSIQGVSSSYGAAAANFGAVRWTRGAEIDVLVGFPGVPTRAVTVIYTADGLRAEVVEGAIWEPVDWAGELPPQVVVVRAGEWGEGEVARVAHALAALTEDELEVIRGLELERIAGRGVRNQAFFSEGPETYKIEFTDEAFEASPTQFVGSASAPRPPEHLVVLHEIAHALALSSRHRARRALVVAGEAGDAARFAEAIRVWRRARSSDPVIEAFRRARGPERGPTPYGRKNIHESFAEAFGLFKTDPDALMRVMPRTAAWFAQGGHVVSARAAFVEPPR